MDPLLDDPDVQVAVFTNEAACFARLTHTPTGTVAFTRPQRIGQIEAKEQAAAKLREMLKERSTLR